MREPLLTRQNLLIAAGVAVFGGLVTWMMLKPTRGFRRLALGDVRRTADEHYETARAAVNDADARYRRAVEAAGRQDAEGAARSLREAKKAALDIADEIDHLATHYINCRAQLTESMTEREARRACPAPTAPERVVALPVAPAAKAVTRSAAASAAGGQVVSPGVVRRMASARKMRLGIEGLRRRGRRA